MEEIVGDSIILRKYCHDDAEYIHQWINDKKTTIYMGKKFRNPATLKQIKTGLTNVIESKSENSLFYVIADKETKEYMGGIDLTSIDPIDKTCVLSIIVSQVKFRNKGIASESISLLLEIAFNTMKLHKIELGVYEKNIPAIRCYQKNGFVTEGLLRDHMLINGKYANLIKMGLIDYEYKK